MNKTPLTSELCKVYHWCNLDRLASSLVDWEANWSAGWFQCHLSDIHFPGLASPCVCGASCGRVAMATEVSGSGASSLTLLQEKQEDELIEEKRKQNREVSSPHLLVSRGCLSLQGMQSLSSVTFAPSCSKEICGGSELRSTLNTPCPLTHCPLLCAHIPYL